MSLLFDPVAALCAVAVAVVAVAALYDGNVLVTAVLIVALFSVFVLALVVSRGLLWNVAG
jgi:hypothetical protein